MSETIAYRFRGPASGTWTPPMGETEALMIVRASGGPGGDGYVSGADHSGGTGGGGGGFAMKLVSVAGLSFDYEVGGASSPGSDGDEAWIKQSGSYVVRASGGEKGIQSTNLSGGNAGGAGGQGLVGDTLNDGGAGVGNGHTGGGFDPSVPPGPNGRTGGSSAGTANDGVFGSVREVLIGGALGPLPSGSKRGGYGGDTDANTPLWPHHDGEAGEAAGGGGGGGAVYQDEEEAWHAADGGDGAAGEIIIYCPPPPQDVGPCCCTPCPTREDLGLPETLTPNLAITSSGSAGMPSDIAGASCSGADPWYYRFSEDHSLIQMLVDAGLTFEYTEAGGALGCGFCCLRYSATGSYEPECPDDAGSGKILWGASPFSAKAVGADETFVTIYSGPNTGASPEFEPWAGACCPTPSEMNCNEYGPDFQTYGNTTISLPLPVWGTCDLFVCVDGNTVRVCVQVVFQLPCAVIESTDGCSYSPWAGTAAYPDCTRIPSQFCEDEETETCAIQTVTLNLQFEADITEVEGATVWDKIQAATFSESEYEYSVCSCADGGCTGGLYSRTCGCGIAPTCFLLDHELGNPAGTCEWEDPSGDPSPIDSECIYSVGSVSVSF